MSGRAGRSPGGVIVALGLLLAAGWPLGAQDREAIDRLLFEAQRREQEGDVAAALRSYELLCEQFPESPEAAEALLRLVEGYRARGDSTQAERAARTLIGTHPRKPQAAGAYTRLGELLEARATDREALSEARSTYDNAVLLFPRAAYPGLAWRSAAAVASARLALVLGLDAEAALSLAEVIDHDPPSLWSATARFELAGLLLDQDRWLEAADLLQEIAGRAWEGEEELRLAARARARLDLIHRFWLRPAAGQERWLTARQPGGGPERAVAVAASDSGVAVVGADGSTVHLDPQGGPLGRWSYKDADGASWAGGEVLVTTPDMVAVLPGPGSMSFAAPPSEKKPTLMPLVAIEPAAFGHWFVLAAKPERLFHYEPLRRRHRALVEGKGREPVDLARDRRGRVLVLDAKAREVTRFGADGASQGRVIAGDWRRPEALAVDVAGNIYVLDRERGIELFDRRGKRLAELGSSPGGIELRRPLDLSVDGAGRLWIADGRIGLVVLE